MPQAEDGSGIKIEKCTKGQKHCGQISEIELPDVVEIVVASQF